MRFTGRGSLIECYASKDVCFRGRVSGEKQALAVSRTQAPGQADTLGVKKSHSSGSRRCRERGIGELKTHRVLT